MSSLQKKYHYSAFGLNFQSDLELPELAGSKTGLDTVTIEYGKVQEELDERTDQGGVYQVRPGSFLLSLEGVGRFLVQEGRAILVQPENGASEDDLRVFLLGACFGALLHQRGVLALHASAVVSNEGALLFTGASGSGKSTTAAAFLKRGYRLLADDLIAITLNQDQPFAYPGLTRLKLWRDSLVTLDYDPQRLSNVRPGTIHRYTLPAQDFHAEPIPIRAVFNLDVWNQDKFECKLQDKTGSFGVLLHNTYRARYIEGLQTRAVHFQVATKVSNRVPVYRINRPDRPFRLDELLEVVSGQLG